MNSPELFGVEVTPRYRRSNRAECEALKAKYGIITHCMPDRESKSGRNWMALSMPAAIKKLEGYDLTDEEKTDLSAIVAGYGRLLDECGLLIDGQPTEFEAVKVSGLGEGAK